ncbi:MAG: hypothetical protein AAF696_20330 [Bacteroidota bacterium]
MKPILRGRKFPFLFCLILFMAACEPENPVSSNENQSSGYPGVEEALWSYFEDFEEEGRNRGYNINIRAQGITGEIAEIDQEHVAGRCTFNFRAPNHITIDQEFWQEVPNRSIREMIIFHELGHCYLGQDHREGVLNRNICASIMRSGTEGCFDNYTTDTRSYYLDELFDFEDN